MSGGLTLIFESWKRNRITRGNCSPGRRPVTVQAWLNGKRTPQLGALLDICRTFDTSPLRLLTLELPRSPSDTSATACAEAIGHRKWTSHRKTWLLDFLAPNYRFENWNRLRAPGWPDFLRSLILGSRVRRPSSFSVGRIAASCCSNARAMANRTAPACPAIPPPVVFTLTSNELLVLVTSNGFSTVDCSDGVAKYSSNGRPLTSILPEPRETRTCATAVLRRPVAANTSDIF